MKTLIVIVGPTGVGKTEASLSIAEHLRVPIINADSRQIYAELPIGTAAPTAEQQKRVKHFFVGTRHIEEYYNASMYENEVLALLKDLFGKSDIALMSGGSMMYIDAVCDGIDDIPTIDNATRETMKQRLAKEGLPSLVEELKRMDYDHWLIVDKNNPRRVVHALEICHYTGKTYTSFRRRQTRERPFSILKVGLNTEREQLYANINKRVMRMIGNGLVEEAHAIYPQRRLNALNTVGYKELFEYFDGNMTLEEAIAKIQSNTRRYSRKQLTWFKKDERIKWFAPCNIKEIINYVDASLQDNT